jgi:hypothetical protein
MAFSSLEELEKFIKTVDSVEGLIPKAEAAKLLTVARGWRPKSGELRYALTMKVFRQFCTWAFYRRLHRQTKWGATRVAWGIIQQIGVDEHPLGPIGSVADHARKIFLAMGPEGLIKKLPKRKPRKPKPGKEGS